MTQRNLKNQECQPFSQGIMREVIITVPTDNQRIDAGIVANKSPRYIS